MVGFCQFSIFQILVLFHGPSPAFLYQGSNLSVSLFLSVLNILFLNFFSSRILFKDKDRNWEEIENKLRAESEVPIVKTSSMV